MYRYQHGSLILRYLCFCVDGLDRITSEVVLLGVGKVLLECEIDQFT